MQMDEEAALQVYEWGFSKGWDIELREGPVPRFVLSTRNVSFYVDLTMPRVRVTGYVTARLM